MIKRLIFDVDNTLIRNLNFKDAIKDALIEYNIYTEERLNNFLENIKEYEIKYNNYNKKDYLNFFSKVLNTKLDEEYLNIHFKHLKKLIPKDNNELINTLDNLSKKYELVILTNYFKESQKNRLVNMGIDKYFIEYYGEDIIKPYKKSFIKACGNYKLEECVMIGDSIELDIIPAKELGINTIYISKEKNPNYITVEKVEDITNELITNIEKL